MSSFLFVRAYHFHFLLSYTRGTIRIDLSKTTIKMVDTTDDVIKSLQESPEGVKKLNNLQMRRVLKRLFVSQNEKDEEISSLKKKVQDLESKGNKTDLSPFDTLFAKNVPHILEKIFLSLDYESFKACQRVNTPWNVHLTSASFIKKARTLFQKGIKDDQVVLWQNSRCGKTEEVRILLSTGLMNLNAKFKHYSTLSSTPLYEAADRGYIEVVRILLDKGAGPDEGGDTHGRTPLIAASDCGHKDVVKLLLDRGAKTDKFDNEYGVSPLHCAVYSNHMDVAQLLLDRGADPNSTHKNGDGILHIAAWRGNKHIVELLLDKGADPNKADKGGCTPLSIALEYHHLHIANMLQVRGAKQ